MMRNQREHGCCDLLSPAIALGIGLALLSIGCSSSYDHPAPRRLVERGGAIDPAALDPSATSILLSSDAGMQPLASDPAARNVAFCALAFDAGTCTAPMNVYWHNPATGVCELKIYWGCEGNGNRFASVGECVELCGGSAPAPCESTGQMYQPGQPVETECGTCECEPAGSGELRCPQDAGPCEAQNFPSAPEQP
jgi:hypothetical protein